MTYYPSLRFTFFRDYFFGRLFVDLLYFPYDIHIIFKTYKHTFGRYPNIIRPTPFNEYIQHSKVFRRKSLQTAFADRVVVRDYVTKRIGERHLNRLLWSGDDLREAEIIPWPGPYCAAADIVAQPPLVPHYLPSEKYLEHLRYGPRCLLHSDHAGCYGRRRA